MKEMIIEIPCVCSFRLGIRAFDMDEIAAGVWGTINCPACGKRLNPTIQEVYDNTNTQTTDGISEKSA